MMPKKKSPQALHLEKVQQALKMKYLLLGALLGIVVGSLSAVVVTSMNRSRAVQDQARYHPATFAVAEKFMCGCPECVKELRNCQCQDSRGGIYELHYISERLRAGLAEQQVIRDVYAKFGKIKPEFQYLLGSVKPSTN